MSFVYEGGAEGTLKVSASFGDIVLPATRQEGEGQVGINAFGRAAILMPDKAALEACIASKAAPGDEDMQTIALPSCREKTPSGAAPIDVKVQIQIALDEDKNVSAELKRTYLEKSNALGGVLALESVPPLKCTQLGE